MQQKVDRYLPAFLIKLTQLKQKQNNSNSKDLIVGTEKL